MTTRSQKKKTVEEPVSRYKETPITENSLVENLIARPSKCPKIQPENEIKTSLRKEIMSDLTKIHAENQTELLKLMAPTSKTLDNRQSVGDFDSETK